MMLHVLASSSFLLGLDARKPSLLQTWKNQTVAEQEKRPPQERPVLLSKDIEAKLALLDREVNYLLNKAKFAKPKAKAKAKNGTSSDKSSKSDGGAEEKTAPPAEEDTQAKSGGWIVQAAAGGGRGVTHNGAANVSRLSKQRRPRKSSLEKPRPPRRTPRTEKQTAERSRQKKQQPQVRLPNHRLTMLENCDHT